MVILYGCAPLPNVNQKDHALDTRLPAIGIAVDLPVTWAWVSISTDCSMNIRLREDVRADTLKGAVEAENASYRKLAQMVKEGESYQLMSQTDMDTSSHIHLIKATYGFSPDYIRTIRYFLVNQKNQLVELELTCGSKVNDAVRTRVDHTLSTTLHFVN